MKKESDFDSRHVKPRQKISMVTLKGEIPSSTSRASPAEKVLKDYIDIDVNSLPLRDPACLVISQLHECLLAWQLILHVGDDLDQSDILKWLKIMLGGSTSHWSDDYNSRIHYLVDAGIVAKEKISRSWKPSWGNLSMF